MATPTGPHRTPDLRMPDRFDEYLLQETIAGRIQLGGRQ
jgi:hypothetical protein